MLKRKNRLCRRAAGIAVLASLLAGCTATADDGRKVVFDEGHGQRFLVGQESALDLSGLAEILRKEGLQVETTRETLSEQVLAGKSGLVISGPFAPLQPAEIDAVAAFVERGGKLCVTLHIAPPAAPLLGRLGVVASNGVVHENNNVIGDRTLDFRVNRLRPHPLTTGLTEFSVYGSWALINATADAQVVARTSANAWVDLNRNGTAETEHEVPQSLGILVTGELGDGAFAVFGDDAIFQNQFLRDGNVTLAKNLARWLNGG